MNSGVQTIWNLLPHPSPDHVIRLFARKGDKRFGDYARSPDEIERFIGGSQGMNIYLAPNPTKQTLGTRHSAEHVTHWSYMFLDVDPVEENSRALVALEEALLWLGEWMGRDFGPKGQRPIIIDSGRGAQAWIRLEDIVMMDQKMIDWHPELQERKIARKTMGYWLKKLADKLGTYEGCRLDSCTSDLPRVMRCPGTVNIKTGRMAELLEPSPVIHGGLAHLMVTTTPKAVFTEPEPGQYPPGTPWQMVFTELTRKAQNYLLNGREEPGRHEIMWHAARCLAEKGIERAQTEAALQHANLAMGEDNALPDKDIQHALNTAYAL